MINHSANKKDTELRARQQSNKDAIVADMNSKKEQLKEIESKEKGGESSSSV